METPTQRGQKMAHDELRIHHLSAKRCVEGSESKSVQLGHFEGGARISEGSVFVCRFHVLDPMFPVNLLLYITFIPRKHAKQDTTLPEQMKRPHMDAFLTAVYEYYDLCVWSQTSWRWLELKLTELGFLSNPNYRWIV